MKLTTISRGRFLEPFFPTNELSKSNSKMRRVSKYLSKWMPRWILSTTNSLVKMQKKTVLEVDLPSSESAVLVVSMHERFV